MRTLVAACLALLVLLGGAAPSRADSPAESSRKEAADRFDRGIRLVDSGDLSGGLAEFQRAYTLVPAPVVIYNVGLVYAAMNRPVEAARSLEKALKTRESLKPDVAARAAEVLRQQSEKIGQVVLAANVKEGAVEVDNLEVAQLPLPGPLDVAAGSHVIGVISRGYAPGRKEVVVPAKASVEVAIDVVPIEGLLGHIEVRSHVPAADVFVDGGRVGKTPLETSITVAPGQHTVDVRREGYTSASRTVTLQDGAQSELDLDPTMDKSLLSRNGGSLDVKASEDQAILSADGQELGLLRGPVQLPAGPHRVRVERGGFLAAERDVDVPAGDTKSLNVVFEPTPETRASYVASASGRRTLSWVVIGVGAALAAGGFTLAVVENNQLPKDQAAYNLANSNLMLMSADPACNLSSALTDAQIATCRAALDDANNKVNTDQTLRLTGYIAGGVGAATLVTGVVLLLTGDDPHKYDEKPAESIAGGWRVLPSIGVRGFALSAGREF
jgi:hypothetical protein